MKQLANALCSEELMFGLAWLVKCCFPLLDHGLGMNSIYFTERLVHLDQVSCPQLPFILFCSRR